MLQEQSYAITIKAITDTLQRLVAKIRAINYYS